MNTLKEVLAYMLTSGPPLWDVLIYGADIFISAIKRLRNF